MDQQIVKRIGVCDTQPITIEGLKVFLQPDRQYEFLWAVSSLKECAEKSHEDVPDLLIVDKAFGMQGVMEFIRSWGADAPNAKLIVWGLSMTEAEALRLLQAGARGVIAKSASLTALNECIAAVAAGNSWIEDSILSGRQRQDRNQRNLLTDRERQVKELVEQGFKNWEIARELGIRPGTVKIHLKHIFEKTGVRGRHSLALAGFRQKSDFEFLPTPQ